MHIIIKQMILEIQAPDTLLVWSIRVNLACSSFWDPFLSWTQFVIFTSHVFLNVLQYKSTLPNQSSTSWLEFVSIYCLISDSGKEKCENWQKSQLYQISIDLDNFVIVSCLYSGDLEQLILGWELSGNLFLILCFVVHIRIFC